MSATAPTQESALTRPLKALEPLIHRELEAGDAAGIEHYRAAGEMLLEAKGQIEHGTWRTWLGANFHLTQRTAQRYIQLAEMRPTGRFSSMRAAIRDNEARARHEARLQELRAPVYPGAVERLMEEAQSRKQEHRLVRDEAMQIISIGYRVRATKLHPDKPGGSHEAMQRLNEAKRILKGAV